MGDQLAFFPPPFPDEDFRSLVYRYHIRSGNKKFRDTKNELFGVNSYKNLHLPRNFNYLNNKMPKGLKISLDNILYNNTFFPLIKPFLPIKKVTYILNDIRDGVSINGFSVGNIMKPKNNSILSDSILYCPACLKIDDDNFGEVYIHRMHQLNFIGYCTVHNQRLIYQCPTCGVNLSNSSLTKIMSTPFCENGHSLISFEGHHIFESSDIKRRFINNIKDLINYSETLNINIIIEKLDALFKAKGYKTKSGKYRRKQLLLDIESYYDIKELDGIGININHLKSKDVFIKLFDENTVTDFRFYVLLICFLTGSLKEFIEKDFSNNNVNLMTENGPWLCINKLCVDYGKKEIKNYKSKYENKNYNSYVIKCPKCGMEYSRKWNTNNPEVEVKIRVTEHGGVWDHTVVNLKSKGYSNYKIGKMLNSNPETIRSALIRLKSKIIYNVDEEESSGFNEIETAKNEVSVSIDNKRLIEYKNELLKLVSTKQGLNRTQILKLAPESYLWLRSNDKKWLEKILPPSKNEVDWKMEDKKLAERIERASEQAYAEASSKQVKKGTIIKYLNTKDQGRIRRKRKEIIDKLPLSLKKLEECEETKEQFQIRKLPKIINKLEKKGLKNISYKSLCYELPLYQNCSKDIRDHINKELRERGYNIQT